eukprot:11989378-Heterocapsa_arctica.AAC.1
MIIHNGSTLSNALLASANTAILNSRFPRAPVWFCAGQRGEFLVSDSGPLSTTPSSRKCCILEYWARASLSFPTIA